jgi:hypothetical protein
MQTMRTTNGKAILITGFLLIASAGMFMAHTAKAASGSTNDGPTKENALEAEKKLGQALRTNDADAFCRLLDPDWVFLTKTAKSQFCRSAVSQFGGLGSAPSHSIATNWLTIWSRSTTLPSSRKMYLP